MEMMGLPADAGCRNATR